MKPCRSTGQERHFFLFSRPWSRSSAWRAAVFRQVAPPNLTPLPITDLRVVELGTDSPNLGLFPMAKPLALARMARSI